MNGIVRNISALSIETTGQVPTLTKGQKALLKLIRECVDKKMSLDFESMLQVYYHNVRKTFVKGEGWYYARPGDYNSGRYSEYISYDILECYAKGEMLWRYKPQIRQWFVSNIGILVIKNQLVIIPTIDLGAEEELTNG